MAKRTYSEKLKDPRWQKKRLEILERDSWACVYCGDTKSTLHVHHEIYEGRNPWDTPGYCLSTLCEECHEVEHLTFTPLEKQLLDTVRNRDRGNSEMIKILNKVVKNFKEASLK